MITAGKSHCFDAILVQRFRNPLHGLTIRFETASMFNLCGIDYNGIVASFEARLIEYRPSFLSQPY